MSSGRGGNRLAITCGDPAGIGPEVVASWLAAQSSVPHDVVVIGPSRWLQELALPADQTLAVGPEDYEAVPGEPDAEGAKLAWSAMERAAAGCLAGQFAGVVTGPVSKASLAAVGYPHPGQTEFFAAEWGGEPTMAFCGGRLRVVLLSWHIPLKDVPAALTPMAVRRAVAAAAELAQAEGVMQPRIGVCGLNPHAGEGGLLGIEEREVLNPELEDLRERFPGVSLAQPGDTVFGRALRGEFDVVVALYHDQGLAPLKTVDFDTAVNVTLGLPYVRTSPDHGTAFGIAGQGKASATSLGNAVDVARRLVARQRP